MKTHSCWSPLVCAFILLSFAGRASAQTFPGTNAPGGATDFSVAIGAAATNLSATVPGTSMSYSHLLVRRGQAPTDTTYDFVSAVTGQTNAVHLELPEASPGTYYFRVRTPAGSATHGFSLKVETNRTDLRGPGTPVMKSLAASAVGTATNSSRHYFRVELATNAAWKIRLDATHPLPDLYLQRNALPTDTVYLKRSTGNSNDLLSLLPSEGTPGSYYIGIFGTASLGTSVPYSLFTEPMNIVPLGWDPGTTHAGTLVHSNLAGTAGDYYFRITTGNPALGAWRTALKVLAGEAGLFLSRGALPTPAAFDFKSERPGSDGVVLASTQFAPNEDWYLLVRANAGAQWTLVSGAPFVTDLGMVATDTSSGSGNVDIGPEGMRFFSATAPADMLAWRLWLNGATNQILLKKTGVPVPVSGANELSQRAQMLVVPPYLTGGQQYFVGVPGVPGTVIDLDSRQQPVLDLAYGASASQAITGFGYTTYRVQVPANQVAWQLDLPSTNGNPNFALRRNSVPNENYNDAYSELSGSVTDNITLVPPVLSDGTFYVTVYATTAHQFILNSGTPVVTGIDYVSTSVNDQAARVGWRFYVVTDIAQQLGSLGWDLFLSNFAPGTRIALRRNAAPGIWSFRNPNPTPVNYHDSLSAADYLQRPGHQADVWYIGVYNPTNALGGFTLNTRELQAAPLSENTPVPRTDVEARRWEFFKVQLPASVAGVGPILGWDVRLTGVTGGLPRVIIRREGFPVSGSTTITTTATNWPSGGQWASTLDWTRRQSAADGTNETGRILAMAMGRPLEPATYYIGVIDETTTNRSSYSILSRWIGADLSIPVQDLPWQGGRGTNVLTPREAGYYRVSLPADSPSWKVRLSTSLGESMLVITTNWIPNIDSEKRMQKDGNEHYVLLPQPGFTVLQPGNHFLAVVSEGATPAAPDRVGSGATTTLLETLGPMPEIALGTLTTTDLVRANTLEGGESIAYHFQTLPSTLGFWIFLENTVGIPTAVSRGGLSLADPGLGSDIYGNQGGETVGAIASSFIITVADPFPNETIMVKARGSGATYPDASYTLRVREIVPEPLAFDAATVTVADVLPTQGRFFAVDVPADARGWDIRLTNITSGNPRLAVMRDYLPISLSTSPGFLPALSTSWPSGSRWAASRDWTERSLSATGEYEDGRILAMGMGRPLEPGRYYVGILNGGGSEAMGCSLVSRGIGSPYSIPVTDLAFTGGNATLPALQPREAAYFRVTIPADTPSWKMHLSTNHGEALLIALKDCLPNVGALATTSATNASGGRKMQKIGDEEFLLLPPAGMSHLIAGDYFVAVVGEGDTPPSGNAVGSGTSSVTVSSIGPAPVQPLGTITSTDTVVTGTLRAGETCVYQFQVTPGTLSVEASLEDRVNNPIMVLRPGPVPPNPGTVGSTGTPPVDNYGNDGGETLGNSVHPTLITIANPSNTVYSLVVKARPVGSMATNASYTLRLNASGASLVTFDGGSSSISGQTAGTWRYFRVQVPTNAVGWDLRLTQVNSGLPRMVVRRGSLPNTMLTTSGWIPVGATSWPSNHQWAVGQDWTKRSLSIDGLTNEDGRVFAAGMGRPLEPGLYYMGISSSSGTNDLAYTVTSRGIGAGFALPVVDLDFVGAHTNQNLAAREAAYYRVIVPSNSPSWRLKLDLLNGEAMMSVLRSALPNVEAVAANGTLANGKGMQKNGNEHLILLPATGFSTLPSTTNLVAVVAEGVNPGSTGRIGPGSSGYVLRSLGVSPVQDLGLLTSEDLAQSDALEAGETRAYQFTVPSGTYGMQLRLENRVGNPVAVVRPGALLPDPGALFGPLAVDPYGNDGGSAIVAGHATLITFPNPVPGTYSVMTKARASGASVSDASYRLRVQEILLPEINFSEELNANGLTHVATGLLEDNERAFFKFVIPATVNGKAVIGWKLDLTQSSGLASLRVRRDLLPSDADASSLMPFTTASAIIAPPYLTNGVWFVEVKGTGSTAFTLTSSLLELERAAWVMPMPGQPPAAPGVTAPTFGDTGIDPQGNPLAGNQSIILEQGFLHYYAVEVPTNNLGLLRVQLEGISGNPDLYMRAGAIPTLHHSATGGSGTIYDRSMLAATTEYANWVPLDGKLDARLRPGFYYLAVRASSNANARYRLRVSTGSIADLPLHGSGVTDQVLAGGDWRYYRFSTPTAVPFAFNLTFSQQSGDVWVYLRDTVPPGNGLSGVVGDIKDSVSDNKNNGPYSTHDRAGTYLFSAPPTRLGQVQYIGVRAINDAVFSLNITTNGQVSVEPQEIAFYGGTGTAFIPPASQAVFRVDVPAEATRWKHAATHAAGVVLYLEQGTLPNKTGGEDYRSPAGVANSTLNNPLVTWNPTLKQYQPAAWPWIPGQPYFLIVSNTTALAQDFSIVMDGRDPATDDNDNDHLPDYWELFYFGNIAPVGGTDSDADGVSNEDEFLEGTNPVDAQSFRARLLTSAANGTIIRSPDQATYALGTPVTLTPQPATGYAFIEWSGSATGRQNPLTFVIDGHKTLTASFKLAGDDFVTALPLAGVSFRATGTNVSMTKEPGEPNHHRNPGGKSIWWRWTAPASQTNTLSTAGSAFNTLLGVYTGNSVSNLTEVASDNNSLGGTNRSQVTFVAVVGTTYHFAVDGYNGASGRITLTLSSDAVSGGSVRLNPLVGLPGGGARVTLVGDPNRSYGLEFSTNLPTFLPLSTVTTLGDGTGQYDDAAATNSMMRFYRARSN